MAFYKDKHYQNAIQKIRIDLGTMFGLEKDEDVHILVREPSEVESLSFKKELQTDEVKGVEFFKSILPGLIVEHDFYEDEKNKMSNEEVAELIFDKNEAADYVLDTYANAVFRSRLSKREEK